MGFRCPGCNGKKGRVFAKVTVKRKSPYGEWVYVRFTHKSYSNPGKRVYCYVRIEKLKDLEYTPDFDKLKGKE